MGEIPTFALFPLIGVPVGVQTGTDSQLLGLVEGIKEAIVHTMADLSSLASRIGVLEAQAAQSAPVFTVNTVQAAPAPAPAGPSSAPGEPIRCRVCLFGLN